MKRVFEQVQEDNRLGMKGLSKEEENDRKGNEGIVRVRKSQSRSMISKELEYWRVQSCSSWDSPN